MHQRARCAAGVDKVDEEIQYLGVQDGRCCKVFARRSRAGEDEDTRTDDGSDAKCRERPRPQSFLELMLRTLRVGNQLVDRLTGKQLVVGQWSAPRCSFM